MNRRLSLTAFLVAALSLGVASLAMAAESSPPPATFYGTVQGGVPGGQVLAIITKSGKSTTCGDGVVANDAAAGIVYVIDVVSGAVLSGCGEVNDPVQFYFLPQAGVPGWLAAETGAWRSGPVQRNLLKSPSLSLRSRLPLLSADSVSVPQSGSPTQTVTAGSPTATPTGAALSCTLSASVNNPTPEKNTNITLSAVLSCSSGSPGGASMTSVWNFKTTTTGCDNNAAPNGVASCTRSIGNATSGFFVQIDVTVSKDGQQWHATTGFTPQ